MTAIYQKPPVNVGPGERLYPILGRFEEAEGVTTIANGTVSAVTMSDKGNGYATLSDATVTFTAAPSGGTNATGTCVLGEGVVVHVPVTSGGSGYVTPPAVTFTGGNGTGASAVGVLGPNGSVVAVRVTNRGSGFTSVPTAAIAAAPTGGTNATVGTVACAFRIASVTLTNAGAGYVTAPLATFGNPLQAVVNTGAYTIDAVLPPIIVGARTATEALTYTGPNYTEDGVNASIVVPDGSGGSVILTRSGSTFTTNLRYSFAVIGK